MKVDREEMMQHVERQRVSGKSIAAYARAHDLPYHRLKYWAQRGSAAEAADDAPFVLLGSRGPGTSAGGVRLQLGNPGAELQCAPDCGPEFVAAVCRLVLAC